MGMRLALGAMHRVYGDNHFISDGPYPMAIYHSALTELTVKYSPSQRLSLREAQSFQVVIFKIIRLL